MSDDLFTQYLKASPIEADELGYTLADIILAGADRTPQEWYDAVVKTTLDPHQSIRNTVRWCRLLRLLCRGDARAEDALGKLATLGDGVLVDIAIQEIHKAHAISQWGAVLLAHINATTVRTIELAELCMDALLGEMLDDA